MTTTQAGVVLRHIRGLRQAGAAHRLSDRQLLDRFMARHEEAAFEALLKRHGAMVQGVCRRVLHNAHDAEDAFQATFLVLARRAATISRRESVGGWLYRVAYNTALKAQASAAARRRREQRPDERSADDPLAEVTGRELLTALDEELQRLPETYRAPLVLCYLEGLTRDESAGRLGFSQGTLQRRLEEGRERLRKRLERRGLALSAALLAAGVGGTAVSPSVAASTTRSALLVASGQTAGVGARILGLASGALRPAAGPRKVVGAILLAATLTAVAAGLLALRAPVTAGGDPAPAPAAAPAADKHGRDAAPAEPPKTTLVGRVVDAAGKPVAGAEVAAVAHALGSGADNGLPYTMSDSSGVGIQTLDRARADGEGRFRLKMPPSLGEITLMGTAAGHAVGWEPVEIKDGPAEAVLRLPAEESVRGRLVDLQGQPAPGVKVYLLKAARKQGDLLTALSLFQEAIDSPFWPAPVTSDEQGRFILRGVNRSMALTARAHDHDRYAMTDLMIEPGQKEEPRLALAPARVIEGRVLKEDTREPFPGVGIWLSAYNLQGPHHSFGLFARTDKEGRFRVNHYAADSYYVHTEDTEGLPYFAINHIDFKWPDKRKTKHTFDIVLPHGVLQAGKLMDAATGKPVAGARLMYIPRLYNNPLIKGDPNNLWTRQIARAETKADGTFRITVLPGPGHVVVNATGYVSYARYHNELFGEDQLGPFWTANGFIPVDTKPGAPPAEVTLKLQPARHFRGRLVDADGKPVAQAKLEVRTLSADPHRESGLTPQVADGYARKRPPIPVKDGAFELPACDPTATYRVFVLDEENRRGATALLPGSQPEDKPVTVCWQKYGFASARLVAEGKPAANSFAMLRVREAIKLGAGEMNAGAPFLGDQALQTDAGGKVALDRLIPGVRYVLLKIDGKELKEFTVEPGQKRDLGDVMVDAKL